MRQSKTRYLLSLSRNVLSRDRQPRDTSQRHKSPTATSSRTGDGFHEIWEPGYTDVSEDNHWLVNTYNFLEDL